MEAFGWDDPSLFPCFVRVLQDEVVSRVLLPSRRHASVELEVLHDTAEVAPFLPFVSPRQLIAVISAPRAFIDRTGLGVRPVQDGRFFPEFDGQSLLGDSTVSNHLWRSSPVSSALLVLLAVLSELLPAFFCFKRMNILMDG